PPTPPRSHHERRPSNLRPAAPRRRIHDTHCQQCPHRPAPPDPPHPTFTALQLTPHLFPPRSFPGRASTLPTLSVRSRGPAPPGTPHHHGATTNDGHRTSTPRHPGGEFMTPTVNNAPTARPAPPDQRRPTSAARPAPPNRHRPAPHRPLLRSSKF